MSNMMMHEGVVGEPKSMTRAKKWSEQAEEAWRFQQAGYRDVFDYNKIRRKQPERWESEPHRVKKLEVVPKGAAPSGDLCHYMYFDRSPELQKREIHTVKLYVR